MKEKIQFSEKEKKAPKISIAFPAETTTATRPHAAPHRTPPGFPCLSLHFFARHNDSAVGFSDFLNLRYFGHSFVSVNTLSHVRFSF